MICPKCRNKFPSTVKVCPYCKIDLIGYLDEIPNTEEVYHQATVFEKVFSKAENDMEYLELEENEIDNDDVDFKPIDFASKEEDLDYVGNADIAFGPKRPNGPDMVPENTEIEIPAEEPEAEEPETVTVETEEVKAEPQTADSESETSRYEEYVEAYEQSLNEAEEKVPAEFEDEINAAFDSLSAETEGYDEADDISIDEINFEDFEVNSSRPRAETEQRVYFGQDNTANDEEELAPVVYRSSSKRTHAAKQAEQPAAGKSRLGGFILALAAILICISIVCFVIGKTGSDPLSLIKTAQIAPFAGLEEVVSHTIIF
ncbi:MAG: hypothetical protein E7514_07620 [Ruminococcaceae bacterium]|nr:hypothetical protein [Oscillospiraceae bacterium]